MKHTILFVAANPEDTHHLLLDRECAAIQRELRAAGGHHFEFHSRWSVGVDELLHALNDFRPSIVHFSAHGAEIPRTVARSGDGEGARDVTPPQEGGLLLHEEFYSQTVSGGALADLLASAPPVPRLVVLNACHSVAVADAL